MTVGTKVELSGKTHDDPLNTNSDKQWEYFSVSMAPTLHGTQSYINKVLTGYQSPSLPECPVFLFPKCHRVGKIST